MNEEKKTQYFYLNICKIGLLFIALGLMRALSIHQDPLSYILGFIGCLLVIAHVKSLEKKWGVSKKYSLVSAGIFAVIFLPMAYWFAYPL